MNGLRVAAIGYGGVVAACTAEQTVWGRRPWRPHTVGVIRTRKI